MGVFEALTVQCPGVSESDEYLLPGVIWQVGTGSKHWPVVLDGETFQLGPESLLLLRHHAVSSTLRRERIAMFDLEFQSQITFPHRCFVCIRHPLTLDLQTAWEKGKISPKKPYKPNFSNSSCCLNPNSHTRLVWSYRYISIITKNSSESWWLRSRFLLCLNSSLWTGNSQYAVAIFTVDISS